MSQVTTIETHNNKRLVQRFFSMRCSNLASVQFKVVLPAPVQLEKLDITLIQKHAQLAPKI
jgi:hypothetical protein